MGNAKTFAVMGLIFSAVECVVEKVDAMWRFFFNCAQFLRIYTYLDTLNCHDVAGSGKAWRYQFSGSWLCHRRSFSCER
jgi:hypothetical protein